MPINYRALGFSNREMWLAVSAEFSLNTFSVSPGVGRRLLSIVSRAAIALCVAAQEASRAALLLARAGCKVVSSTGLAALARRRDVCTARPTRNANHGGET